MMAETFRLDMSRAARDEWGVETTVIPVGGRGRYRATHSYTPRRRGAYQILAGSPAGWESYRTGTSLEQAIYQIGSQAAQYPNPSNLLRRTQGGQLAGDRPGDYARLTDVYQTEANLQALLSWTVVDAMGYRPNEQGIYGWGELGAIYQGTPTATIAQQIEKWRSSGQAARAELAERFYTATMRAPEQGTAQSGRYPLRAGLPILYPQLRTGQTDVRLDPGLVSRLTTERPMHRAQKRRYKGGTRVAGALSAIELGKRKLGE